MQVRKISEATRHENSPFCTAYEYHMPTRELDCAVIDLAGRYPASGWAMNTACTSLVHVVEGEGRILFETGEYRLGKDDQLLIEKDDKYALDGAMKLLFSAAPAWSPDQAKNVS